MARQNSIITLNGRIGDLSFYQNRDGFHVRKAKGGFTTDRIKNDPKMQRVRENMAEFGRAVNAFGILKNLLRPLLTTHADRKMKGRLISSLIRVIRSDEKNKRGLRTVAHGDLQLLKGFEFNDNAHLSKIFPEVNRITTAIDRALGSCSISLAEQEARAMVAASPGATHFKFVSAALSTNFENPQAKIAFAESSSIALDAKSVDALTLVHDLGGNVSDLVLIMLGIEFLQVIANGTSYALPNADFNALAVIAVEGQSLKS
jgi:hypothetical protein